ncbi:MAG: hypothetical protein QOF78_1785, partial [Phycisphaerales bacterium]|nr:hypothetical protein [Phycisphaerales bacterium]
TSFDAEGNVTSRTQAATFNQRVVRDSTSDELVFVYSLTIPDADGPVESMQISASSFTDFTTDLQGDFGGSQAMQASRTADGATISGSVADGVAGQGGSFLSFTDADSFNADGSVVLRISNEFETFDAQGSSFGATGVVADLLTLSGTFQPFADAPPPNAIPLPAAVWPGAILLGAVGAKLRWSRRRDA